MNWYSSKRQPPINSKWNQILALATAWSEHKTAELKTYYYNHITGLSTYIKPCDETEKAFGMKQIGNNNPWRIVFTDKQHYFFYNKETGWTGWFPPDELLDSVVSNLSKEEKEELLDPTTAFTSDEEDLDDEADEENQNEHVTEGDMEHDEEIETPQIKKQKIEKSEPEIPVEIRLNEFKKMLKECDVSPFNTWEQELPKFILDERYKAVSSCTPKEIKSAFDSYCKARAIELKDVQRNRIQDARDAFTKILYVKATLKSFFEDVYRISKKNVLASTLSKKECEQLFKDHIKMLKDKEAEKKMNDYEKIKSKYRELLSETRQMGKTSKFSEIKHLIDKDQRYLMIKSLKEREDLFLDYIQELTHDANENTTETSHGTSNSSLKERMKQVIKDKEKQERDMERNKRNLFKGESRTLFKTILIDTLKATDLTYKQCLPAFEQDDRWSKINHEELTESDKKSLFEEHLKELKNKRKTMFFNNLSIIDPKLGSDLSHYESIIKNDSRFSSFSDELILNLFNDFMQQKSKRCEKELKELIRESKFIQFQYIAPQCNKKPVDLEDIHMVLKDDKRYLVFSDMPSERDELLLQFVQELRDEAIHNLNRPLDQ